MSRLEVIRHGTGEDVEAVHDGDPKGNGQCTFNVTCLADIQEQSFEFWWAGRIPRGELTIIAGSGDVGKTVMVLDLIARRSAGKLWPNEVGQPTKASSALLITSEDSLTKTIYPRLRVAGADFKRIHFLNSVTDPETGELGLFDMSEHAVDLYEYLAVHREIDCVLVDPISVFYGNRIDSNAENQIRRCLTPIISVAHDLNVAIIGIAHFRKGGKGGSAGDRLLGSVALRNAARVVWHVQYDRDDMAPPNERRRVFVVDKFNIERRPTGLAFWIEPVPTEQAVPRTKWGEAPVTMTSDEADGADSEKARLPIDDAADWYTAIMANGPIAGTGAVADGIKLGFSKKTQERARIRLDIGWSRTDGMLRYSVVSKRD